MTPRYNPAGQTRVTQWSRLELLPVELLLLISEELPGESRIVLALTSRTMKHKTGEVGPGTSNVATDEPDEHWPRSPRMPLLDLLERDALLLTACDYCRKLHSPFWSNPGPDGRRCGERAQRFDLPFPAEDDDCGAGCCHTVPITQPLVRAVSSWHRRGLDALSLLGNVCRSMGGMLGPYSYVIDYKARVVDGHVLLRHQLFLAGTLPPKSHDSPTAQDVAALKELCGRFFSGLGYLAGLRCMLTHSVPCRSCKGPGYSSGRVDGSDQIFVNSPTNAIPAPKGSSDRILVFTAWRDLGTGSSEYKADWGAYTWGSSSGHQMFRHPNGFSDCGMLRNGRMGDVYEAYEGAARGTAYVPELPRYVEQKLF